MSPVSVATGATWSIPASESGGAETRTCEELEVPQVGDRLSVSRRPPGVVLGPGVAVLTRRLEHDEVDPRAVRLLEGQLGAAQDLASQ